MSWFFHLFCLWHLICLIPGNYKILSSSMFKVTFIYTLYKLSLLLVHGGKTGQQTVRLTTPATTILKTAAGVAGQQLGGKQIITVQKAGGIGQPQIVTLVKTTQGMQVQQVQQQQHQQSPQMQTVS